MSLDELTQYVRPGGPAETPCPFCHGVGKLRDVDEDAASIVVPCAECGGTGVVVSLQVVAIREALWEECPYWHDTRYGPYYFPLCGLCKGLGSIARSYAEAMLLLPEATRDIWDIQAGSYGPVWIVFLFRKATTITMGWGEAENFCEAICAAVLAGLKKKGSA